MKSPSITPTALLEASDSPDPLSTPLDYQVIDQLANLLIAESTVPDGLLSLLPKLVIECNCPRADRSTSDSGGKIGRT